MIGSAPAFSVIIPTKDRPAMLARAIRSVLAQHDHDYEVIVADDGTGQGAALAQALVGEGAGFETGSLGQVPARNMAIRRARGRWIAFLDDDDWWASPDYLGAMRAALASGPFAYASGRIVRETAAMEPRGELPFRAFIDTRSIRHDNTLLIPGIAYARSLHADHGPFDETLPVYWDWDWYLRLADAGIDFVASANDGVRVSARTDNVSAAGNEAIRAAELTRLCQRHRLIGVALKNHESIAIEQRDGADDRTR